MAPPKGHKPYLGDRIDIAELTRLSELHLTQDEMADWFKCSRDLLDQKKYKEIILEGRSKTKQRLKQKALQRALIDNSDNMLKFCLKNYCGWTENDASNNPSATATVNGMRFRIIQDSDVTDRDNEEDQDSDE